MGMGEPIHESVRAMSIRELENSIIDALVYNGMSEDEAEKKMKTMSTQDIEEYLSVDFNDAAGDNGY